jgi:hypothetical protein
MRRRWCPTGGTKCDPVMRLALVQGSPCGNTWRQGSKYYSASNRVTDYLCGVLHVDGVVAGQHLPTSSAIHRQPSYVHPQMCSQVSCSNVESAALLPSPSGGGRWTTTRRALASSWTHATVMVDINVLCVTAKHLGLFCWCSGCFGSACCDSPLYCVNVPPTECCHKTCGCIHKWHCVAVASFYRHAEVAAGRCVWRAANEPAHGI